VLKQTNAAPAPATGRAAAVDGSLCGGKACGIEMPAAMKS